MFESAAQPSVKFISTGHPFSHLTIIKLNKMSIEEDVSLKVNNK